ncbi:MAG: hypothetical protein ABW198_06005 [Pseudorhodoplanes sp.]
MRSLVLAMMTISMTDAAFAQRNTPGCRDAIGRYNAVIQDVSAQLQVYTTCVTNSRGSKDCGGAFSRLRAVQGGFEDAVNAMRQECQ